MSVAEGVVVILVVKGDVVLVGVAVLVIALIVGGEVIVVVAGELTILVRGEVTEDVKPIKVIKIVEKRVGIVVGEGDVFHETIRSYRE